MFRSLMWPVRLFSLQIVPKRRHRFSVR